MECKERNCESKTYGLKKAEFIGGRFFLLDEDYCIECAKANLRFKIQKAQINRFLSEDFEINWPSPGSCKRMNTEEFARTLLGLEILSEKDQRHWQIVVGGVQIFSFKKNDKPLFFIEEEDAFDCATARFNGSPLEWNLQKIINIRKE